MSAKIVIADDSALIRQSVKALLAAGGHWEICGEAQNGREAIDTVEASHPDIVILDMSMPVMDGLMAAAVIHRNQPHLPIVMYTLYSSPQLESEARHAGVCKVVSKTQPNELLTALKCALVKYPAVKPPKPAMA